MKAPTSTLRAAREQRGLSIRQLHSLTRIATGRLSMLERHLVSANPSDRERLASALGMPAEALFPPGRDAAA
jgi:transcriptional regulator with XRE-family HTH domain